MSNKQNRSNNVMSEEQQDWLKKQAYGMYKKGMGTMVFDPPTNILQNCKCNPFFLWHNQLFMCTYCRLLENKNEEGFDPSKVNDLLNKMF